MPNWCSNLLVVTGPTVDVEKFAAHAARSTADREDGSPFSLEALVPVTPEVGMHANDAHVAAWGTKWDVDADASPIILIDDGLSAIEYGFSTAWSPAYAALRRASADFPELTLHLLWDEQGSAYATFAAGRVWEAEIDEGGMPLLVLTDSAQVPLAAFVPYADPTGAESDTIGEEAAEHLRRQASGTPQGRVLVSYARQQDAQRCGELTPPTEGDVVDYRATVQQGGSPLSGGADSANVLLLGLSRPSLLAVLLSEDCIEDWYDACGCNLTDLAWLPPLLAQSPLAEQYPRAALTAQLAVSLDVDPAVVADLVAEFLTAGSNVAEVLTVLAGMHAAASVPPAEDVLTVITGILAAPESGEPR